MDHRPNPLTSRLYSLRRGHLCNHPLIELSDRVAEMLRRPPIKVLDTTSGSDLLATSLGSLHTSAGSLIRGHGLVVFYSILLSRFTGFLVGFILTREQFSKPDEKEKEKENKFYR